jgi:hypothetical protein
MVGLERRPFNRVIDAGVVSVAPENAIFRANMLMSRRRSKNSGGRIAPAAIAGLIRGAPCSVNAFRVAPNPKARPENADKVLMRLNFPVSPANG